MKLIKRFNLGKFKVELEENYDDDMYSLTIIDNGKNVI